MRGNILNIAIFEKSPQFKLGSENSILYPINSCYIHQVIISMKAPFLAMQTKRYMEQNVNKMMLSYRMKHIGNIPT